MFGSDFSIRLINQDKLSDLIKYAYTHHDGVIILTAGMWDKDLPGLLADWLDLSEDVAEKFRNCHFHSAWTDQSLFDLSAHEVRALDKKTRLEKIIASKPELKDKHIVMLDDDVDHINSFNFSKNVTGIWATTKQKDDAFYIKAQDALDNARLLELQKKEKKTHTFTIKNGQFFSETLKLKRIGSKRTFEEIINAGVDENETPDGAKRKKISDDSGNSERGSMMPVSSNRL